MKTKILLNMSRFIIAIILWGTISNVAIGQTWQWVKQLTQNPNPNLTDELDIYDLKLSSTNNIYILGAFKDTINLDGTGGVGFGGTPAKTDIFLIKTDADGTLSWIKTAGSTGNENPQALDIDDSENIYIVGGFQGTCNFSGTPITAAGTKMDGFIAKYNSGGILQWAKRVATGTSDDDNERLTGITINSAGTLFVTGLFKSTTAQIGDGGVNDSTFTNADANPDLFLASYDSDGNFNWASRYANTGANSIFRGMCIGTQGNVYFGGALFGTITIEGNNYSHSPVSTTYGDIILVKANPTNGDIYWVRKGGGSLDDQLNHVTVSEDDVYISGYLQGTGTIDSTATLQSGSYTSSGSADFFLAKYNIDGRLQWKRNLGSSGMDNSYGINVRENIVVTTGFFSNSVTFNTKTITSGGGYDTGFFVFDTDGNPITAESVSGTAEDKGQGVAYDLEGNTYVGGYFLSPTLTVGTTTLTNSGSTFKDIFFAKYQNPFSVTKVHSKNVTCNGGNDGEITVVPYFGKYPYTYVWTKNGAPFSDTDSVLTGLSSGTYAVTVTDDNSEVATTSYTVTQPSTAVNATETITNVSCFNKSDGAIAITVSGGNSPYTFYWSSLNGSGYDEDAEDQTGLTDGTYSFTITDEDGCTFEDDYTVTQPDEINIPGVITNITDPGFNGGVDITPSGGSGTFSDFSWKDESDDEVATSEDLSGINFGGNYEVIVTDNTSCKDSATFNIVDERVFDIWISSQTNINCRDSATGAATVSYSGNVGTVTFSWNSGEVVASISDKTAATYTVEVTDDKGTPLDPDDDETLTESVTLSQPLSALSGSIVPTHVTCYGGSNGKANLTPSGGTPGYSYSWNTDPVITDQDLNGITVGDYEVIITDSKGCTFATSTTITQPDDIDFTVDPVEPTCNGGSNGSLSVSELTGGTSPYTYLWSTTQTSPEITDRSAGSYWIKVTDSRSCYKYQYPVLGQPAAITVSNTSIIYPTCPESTNGSIDITVSGGTGSKTFSWSGPGITSPEDEDQTGLGVGTYNLVVTDANLCTKSHQVILTAQYSSPTVTANTTDAEVCTGESVTLTGGGAVSYEWDNGVTNGVAFEPATTLTYTVTGTDSHGCIDTDQTTVTVDPLPSAPAAGNVTACYDGAAHAGTATVGAGEVVDWYDAATDGNLVSAPAGTNPGTYFAYAEARVTASGCVSASRTLVTVTIYALPSVTASATDSEVCVGESVTLTGGGAVSYEWDNSVTDGVAFVPTSTTTYTVTGTDSHGCTDTEQTTVTVYSLPTVTASVTDSEVCAGESVIFTGGGAVSYEWDNGVTNGVAFEPATTLTYTVTGRDSHGCTDTDQTTVTVDPLPSAPAAGNMTACYDGAAHAGTATVGAGEVVDWYDAASGGSPASAPSGTTAGTYSAYAETRVTATGCVSASRTLVTVTIYALPTVTASATDSEVCAGESVTLTGGGAVSYLWDNGVTDGVAFVPTSTTTYTVTGTDSHGCTDTEQTTVTVYSLPTVTASATDSEVCAGESVIFSGGGAVSYEWDNGVTNGVAFEPSTTLTYTVTGTDAHGCSDTDQTTITVNSLPTVTASATDNEVCAGESVTLTGGGAVSYLWDNGVTNGVAFVPSTTLTYTVTGTDAHGCTDTEQTTVTVYSLPTVTASATDSEVCAGESVTLTGGGAVSYEWDNSVTDGVAFEPSTTLTYTVTGTDAHGCTDTDQTTVTVSSLPTVTLGVFADVCINDPAFTLTGESPSGGSFSGDGVSGTTFTPATAGSGNHTITYNYTDGHGCTNTATSSILVATVPSGGTISSNQTICSGGDPVAFASNDDPTGGKGTWSYGWESKIGSNDWTTISNADALTYDIPAGLTTTTSYRRVATNDCGTAYSNTIVITVNPLPTATISPSGTQYVCDGSSIALNANTAIGLTYRWFKDGSVITGETTSTLGVSAEGDYFAEITNQITGCLNNSNTTSIAVKPVPEASISTTDNLVWCEDENVSVTLTAVDVTSASYQWYRDGIGIPGATSKTYIAHQRGVYDVMVTVDECVSTSNSIEVIVNLLPLSVITTDDSLAYCEGIPVYTVLHASPLAADTYQWYLDGEIIIDATKDSLVATAAGEYTVQIVQTGCDAISEPITIIINPLPEVTLSNFSSLCIDSDPLTLSEGSPLNGTYSGTGVDNGIFDPEVAGTGTYSITYTFTDENGCTNSASSDITVNSLPDVSLGGFDNICINSDPLALSGGTPESGNYSGNGVIDNMFSPELAGVGLHEIVYIYTDNATGCTNSDTSSITVLDKPEVTLGEFNNICSNSSPITLSGGMPEGGAYLINGTIAEVFDPVTAGVGLHEVVYQYTDAATGCTNSDTSSITVYPLPEVTITTSDPLTYCEGATISTTFTATPSNADIYEWYKDGEIISDATSSSYTADTAGVYSVLVTVNGCSTLSSESTVTIIPLPIVSVSTLDKLTWCEGETVHTTFVSNLTSGDSYQWYKNGIAETDSTNQSYTATSSGSYSLEVAVNGCSGMSEEGVITIIPLPVVSIATSDPVSYCADQTIATTLNAFPLNADSYQWYRDGHQEIDSTGQTYLVRGVGNYFVEVTVNGCTAISEDTTITLKPLPVVSISTEDPISWCQGQTISTTITAQTDIGESFSWFKDDVLIEGATSNTITASTAGIYSVTVMANACSATSNEIVITEIQNPIVHIQTSDPASWCYGEPISVTLSADLSGAEAYQWLLNGVENPWANSQSYTATEVGSYTVKVTLGGGCSATSEAFDITTKPLPVATISTNDITAWCEGTSFTVNFTVDISDAESYQWLLNGEVIEGAITQNYSATAAGIYSVEVTVDECPGVSNEIEVTVSSSVTAEITTEDPTVWCEGQTVNTVLFANPSNAQGYQWYLNEVEITGAADHTFTATALGSYTVKVTAGGGCSATSVPIEISSISTPVASFTTTDPLTWCENEDIHVTFISDQTGAESYQWLLNGIPIADATSQTFIADTVGEYSLIVTMGGGCSDTSDITSISIIDVPEITINSADPLVWCEGSTISVTLSADQTDADAYQWYRDDALIDGATAQSYSTSEAGNFYMVATFGNCTATSNELEVILTSTPIASITTNDQTTWCEGDVISSLLYAEPEGAQSYQWLLNGVEITGADDQTFTATAAGSYTVIVTGAGGCNATSTELIISVTPLPIVSITTSDPITWCEGETISTVINADLTGAEAYSWYLNDVLIGEATEQSYTATAGGIYSVEATVNGCSNISNNITITVNPLPEVSISTTDPLAWCEETTIAVNLSAQPTDADSFLWYIDGVALPDSTEQTFSANTTGTYTVEATVNGCSALSEPVTISVYTTPVASIAADEDTTWCSNDVVPITLSAEPEGASEYQWSMNGTAIDGATNQTYITSTPGVYSVNVTLAGGCNASADIILTENQSPVVDLASDTIMIDTQKSYTLDAGTGFTSYLWSDGSTNQTLFVDGAVLGVGIFTYWVEVTNDLGCSTRDTAIVKIKLWDNIPDNISWNVELFPNPTNGEVRLSILGILSAKAKIIVYNSSGNTVFTKDVNIISGELHETMNLNEFTEGIYLIRITDGKSQVVKKIIKE